MPLGRIFSRFARWEFGPPEPVESWTMRRQRLQGNIESELAAASDAA